MDKEQFIVLIKALKSAYSKPDFLPDDKSVKVWFAMLQDLPYEVLNLAIQKHIMTCAFPPTIADLRRIAADIALAGTADWTEAWSRVLDVVGTYGLAGGREGLAQLDDPTREAVRRVGYWSICNSENISLERANFRAAYEAIVAAMKDEAILSRTLIGKITEQKKLIENVNK